MRRIHAILPMLALLAFAAIAHAGSVTLERNDGAIVDAQALQAEAARWPFALHVLVGDYGTKANLMRAAHECVSAPNVVCVGVDPVHHATQSRFGTATGVRPNDFEIIAASGNERFKQGDWRGGIEAIADRARESAASSAFAGPVTVQASAPIVNIQAPQPADSSSHWVLWTLVALIAGYALFLAWRVRRRQREVEEDMRRISDESAAAVSRGEEECDWNEHAKEAFRKSSPRPEDDGYSPPRARRMPVRASAAASVTVVNQGGGGSSGDLALGYMLGRDASPRVVEREVVVRDRESSSSSSWDAGGGGSSFSDSSSSYDSSSSSDSGGGGSDFGSSFDSGGGGFDSGGGGSDF
jgi:hypothetical protein